ncbi:hypothetical protein NFHSH190041_14730 [Shewanella sp. NFH-SH190041]|uniref:YfcZ/YiiS family protein n=1 Tax=Shewanella sp. NFH-SH190041 TaxID=2950245 RepID=UPI0021C2CAB7|nr:YfcZ/YiiS family protein [Shewanella sp. NFH-SH190041]BDM64021.1 hypothetical protein NFHSH190041_14730 [Shewanella sp. NFH-SH190041]
MKSIREAQSDTVNDTCTYCGSFVDIGAVIDVDDTQLVMNFAGEQAMADAKQIAQRAVQRFTHTEVNYTETETGVTLTLKFDVSAEKMIFQLENRI